MSSSSETSSSYSSDSYSSEDLPIPDYYSQLCVLSPIYSDSEVRIGALLDLNSVDKRYVRVVPPKTFFTGGNFEGVEVEGEDTRVQDNAHFRVFFPRSTVEQEQMVIEAWVQNLVDSIKQLLYEIRTDGAKVEYVDPLELEVF